MIEPGDFLGKIAQKEYGDFRLWRYIYAWNKEEIGDNPNLIFPYNFLTYKRKGLRRKQLNQPFLNIQFSRVITYGTSLTGSMEILNLG